MNEHRHLAALAKMAADYAPRTRHLGADGAPTYTNALIHETSPYLLQHAHNPVDWRPWGDAAFAAARERDVPVFLSVGYSTCHWCHVMEHESFEDEEIAAFLNAHFVAVKVDREERPDVDAVHMEFLQLTTGHGGWPMSVWLTPDRRPLYAGTYFPPRDGARGPHRGFWSLLVALHQNWRAPQLRAQAQRAVDALLANQSRATAVAVSDLAVADRLRETYWRIFDRRFGGFGDAPKFPRPCVLEALLRGWKRTGDAGALEMVETTLERMHCGGIYDHVGGGFARYSTDRHWLVPHFEKMLYDNAQLAVAYLEAWQATGRAYYATVTRDILRYLTREMSDPAGGFFSATDAASVDAEGEMREGAFLLWTPAQLRAALPDADATWIETTFDVSPEGNFEGQNILHLDAPLDDADRARWYTLRETLHAVRSQRPAPGLDDKVLVAWNALAISAFARAGRALREPQYIERAVAAARFVLTQMRDGSRLFRAWRRGQAQHPAVLEDYAVLAGALLDLTEATGDIGWLDEAEALMEVLETQFVDPEGGYFRTPADGEALLFRQKPTYDGAEPSGNAQAALALLRLAAITGLPQYVARAEAALRALGPPLEAAPHSAPKAICALEWWHAEVRQLVVVAPEGADVEALLEPVSAGFQPHLVTLCAAPGAPLAQRCPLFRERTPVAGHPTAYLCVGTRCELPETDPMGLRALLART